VSNVLLLINEEAHVRELARLAELLLKTSDLRPVVFLEDRMRQLASVEAFTKLGIEVLTSDGFQGEGGRAALGKHGRWSRRALAGALIWTGSNVRRVLRSFDRSDTAIVDILCSAILKRAGVAAEVLSERPYSAIVLSEENVELDTAAWVAVARRKGVRSVIVPYTISNTAEFIESYVEHAPYQVSASRQNRIVARLFPHWTERHKGHHFMRTSYAKIVAVERLGLSPPNPWLLNSGYVDAIAVESAAMHDYYRAAGIPEHQLAMTGSLSDDLMANVLRHAAERRRALMQDLGLPQDRPLLVAALPPDQKTYDRPGCEFSGFDDLIGFWGQTLAAAGGWNVVVRPHPKTRPDHLDALRRHGVAISYADTAELVPLCDVYVAAVSATIRWAIACGKPVVNYDVYQYGYRDYEGVEAVRLVNTRAEFGREMERVTRDANHRAELTARQQREAGRWGMLDGQTGRRMRALLGNSGT
jgi:hypothetical protein